MRVQPINIPLLSASLQVKAKASRSKFIQAIMIRDLCIAKALSALIQHVLQRMGEARTVEIRQHEKKEHTSNAKFVRQNLNMHRF